MLNLKSAFIALTVIAISTPVMASEVTNSYTNEVSTGKTTVDVQNVRTEVGTEYGIEKAIKVETYGGTTNISTAHFDGKNLTGTGISSNTVVVDPVSIITYSENNSKTEFTDVNKVNLSEVSNFTRTTNAHTVSADN